MTEFIKPQDAAKQLSLSRATIYRWIKEGMLPAYHIGEGQRQPLRVKLDDVIKLIKRVPVKSDDEGRILMAGHEPAETN